MPHLVQLPPMKLVTVSRLRQSEDSGVRLSISRAHAALDLDQVVEGEEAAVARLLLAPREVAGDAEALWRLADLGRDLEQQRVGALAEADDQDLVAGLGLLERGHQQISACAAPVSPQAGVQVDRARPCRRCRRPWRPMLATRGSVPACRSA